MLKVKLLRDEWLSDNSGWAALGITAAALALRVADSRRCYLNPDEVQHFIAAQSSTWAAAYHSSRALAHPPLLILLLHGVLFFGRAEWILRMPSVIAGTAALLLIFAWLRRAVGEIPAIAGVGFMALSPAAISASTEVRQYGLLLFFVSGAIYATERMLDECSVFWAVVQGSLLLLAFLTDYTALLAIGSLDIYVLIRIILKHVPYRVALTAGIFQVALAALLVWLYFWQIRFFVGAPLSYLQPHFYVKGEAPFKFVLRTVYRTFFHVVGFGGRWVTLAAILSFLGGLGAIATGRTKGNRFTAILVICPFVVGFVAALFRAFPFDGTRHQAYLLPFIAAGLSASLALVKQRAAGLLLLTAMVFAPLEIFYASPDNSPRTMPLSDMTAAIGYIHRAIPRGSALFVDGETRYMLEYYLTRDDAKFDAANQQWLGGYRVVGPRQYEWAFQPAQLRQQISQSGKALDLSSCSCAWVISVSWEGYPLASQLPKADNFDVKQFGSIGILRMQMNQAERNLQIHSDHP